MRSFAGVILTILALAQFAVLGINILSIFIGVVISILAGIIGGLGGTRVSNYQRDSDNLATLAQIERNRYFRKHE